MQRTSFGCAKSIAGMSFIALGSFVFYENLNWLLGTVRVEGLSVLPSLILAASQILHAYGADHQHSVRVFLLPTFTLFWPLLLAMTGAIMSREFFTNNFNTPSRKNWGCVDLSAGRSTSE